MNEQLRINLLLILIVLLLIAQAAFPVVNAILIPAAIIIVAVIIAQITFGAMTKIVPEYQRLVIFRFGKVVGSRGPGTVFILPLLDLAVPVDLRPRVQDVAHETCITQDDRIVEVDLVLFWKVIDPIRNVTRIENAETSITMLATALIRTLIARLRLERLLADREDINKLLANKLNEVCEDWGINVTAVELRDIVPTEDATQAVRRQMDARQTRKSIIQDTLEDEKGTNRNQQVISTSTQGAKNSKVFVVHGHDDAAKESVARFLEKLGLTAVILHEQPNAGNTIIEKFENLSDVGFAIVLLTPDDLGAPKDRLDTLRPYARQNVILELGYFLAKIGRSRVCALYREGVEIPSDFQGVLYVLMDAFGAWRVALAKEIKHSGLDVDLNKIL